ncbi:MAG: HNH endonuclease [Ignavibacteria bacterium]|nr:HNH endonuclease [Ignavibacteria bacterium]
MSLFGTIAITDYRWYHFLASNPTREEVNFWTPSSHWTFRAPEFSPFLFKLKAPHNAIAGFGFFVRYAALPDWLAWDCFGEGNGCASFDEMKNRISKIRRRFDYRGDSPIAQIGCIIVVHVTFFSESQWIPQPRDWPVRTLRPTRYDLTVGEGKRVWDECLSRVRVDLPKPTGVDTAVVQGERPRFGSPITMRPRLGQGAFRVAVTEAYGRACAVTKEHSLPALEAAHIRPYSKEGPHDTRNGLLLRADLHRLFEQGYITVTTDFKLEVSNRLRVDYSNGRSYYPFHGTDIVTPLKEQEKPTAEFLKWHNDNIFL